MKTALITMPWGQPTEPAYLMGVMHSAIEKQRKSRVKSFSLFLEFASYIAENILKTGQQFYLEAYQDLIGNYGLGDWVFAVPPFRQINSELDKQYFQYLINNDVDKEIIEYAKQIRDLVPAFLTKCHDEIITESPDVVVFLPMYRECIPSLILALIIKKQTPSIKIIFSGPVCDGPVGAGLIKNFPWIDLVVRDNIEHQIPKIIESFSQGGNQTTLSASGICYRNSNKDYVVFDQAPNNTPSIADIPIPFYDEYFTRLKKSTIESVITKYIWISYRASIGCWWAEKIVCSFCALTGTNIKFISKDSEDVRDELLFLVHKHKHLKFHLFDWIIDPSYLSDLYKLLSSSGVDLTIYLQTRAHLSKNDLYILKNAGAALQIGIESLSTNLLKVMRKGTTAFQNIRLLKWCAELNIKVDWNILYNIPGETTKDYEITIDLAQSLTHLAPPRVNRFRLHPLSPYFENPKAFSITVGNPKLWYYYVYTNLSPDVLSAIAEEFEFSCESKSTTNDSKYVDNLKRVIDYWRKNSNSNYRKLIYKNGLGFIQIIDSREDNGEVQYLLEEPEATIYRLCDDGNNITEITDQIQSQGWNISAEEILVFLNDLVKERIMYQEGNNYLSLAIHLEQ